MLKEITFFMQNIEFPTIEKPTPPNSESAEKEKNILEMYALPGQDLAEVENWHLKYQKADKKFKEKIENKGEGLILAGLESNNLKKEENALILLKHYQEITEETKTISEGLKKELVKTAKEKWEDGREIIALKILAFSQNEAFLKKLVEGDRLVLSENDMAILEIAPNISDQNFLKRLAKKGINSEENSIKFNILELAQNIKDEEFLKKLVEECFEAGNWDEGLKLAENIQNEKFLEELAGECFETSDLERGFKLIRNIQNKKYQNFLQKLVEEGINSQDISLKIRAVELAENVQNEKFLKELAGECFETNDLETALELVKNIKGEEYQVFLQKLAEEGINDKNIFNKINALEIAKNITNEKFLKELAKKCLETNDLETALKLAQNIKDEEYQVFLQKLAEEGIKGINSKNFSLEIRTLELVRNITNEKFLKELAKKCLETNDLETALKLAQNIKDEEFLKRLVKECLENGNLEIGLKLAQNIKSEKYQKFLKKLVKERIEKGINSSGSYIKAATLKLAENIKDEEFLKRLVEECLETNDLETALEIAKNIKGEEYQDLLQDLIEKNINAKNRSISLLAAELTHNIKNENFLKRLVEEKIKKGFPKNLAAKLTMDKEKKAKLEKLFKDLLEKRGEKNYDIEKAIFKIIKRLQNNFLSEQSIKEILKGEEAKERQNKLIEEKALKVIEEIPDKESLKENIKRGIRYRDGNNIKVALTIAQKAQEKGILSKEELGEILKEYFQYKKITSQKNLYENSQGKRYKFGELLKKTGSLTILLDTIPFPGKKEKKKGKNTEDKDKNSEEGKNESPKEENKNSKEKKKKKSFKGKIIIRVIDLEPFLAWKKAFEDYNAWKKAGFGYVPIEPILYFSLQNDLKARVYTAVLDNNLKNLNLLPDERLKKTLKEMGIRHGHLHDSNSCVYFERDKNGKPILDAFPRQYIIDFDRAQFIEPEQIKNN